MFAFAQATHDSLRSKGNSIRADKENAMITELASLGYALFLLWIVAALFSFAHVLIFPPGFLELSRIRRRNR